MQIDLKNQLMVNWGIVHPAAVQAALSDYFLGKSALMIVHWCKLELKRYQALCFNFLCINCSASADVSWGELGGTNKREALPCWFYLLDLFIIPMDKCSPLTRFAVIQFTSASRSSFYCQSWQNKHFQIILPSSLFYLMASGGILSA